MSLASYPRMLRARMIGGMFDIEDINRLKKRGLLIGRNVKIMSGVVIDSSHCWLIEIGNNVTIAPGVHIIAHDASTKYHLGYTKVGRVSIGDNTFIGARSVILPNVRIGTNVIVGAGSVVTRSISDGLVAAGNPATVVTTTTKYMERHRKAMNRRPVFDTAWTLRGKISAKRKREMRTRLRDGIGFVE